MWFFMIIGWIACSGQSVRSFCPVEISPSTAVVKFGDSFSANCTSLSNRTEGMGWESTLGAIPLKDGATSVHLQIDAVTQWSMLPQCFMNELDGQQCSENLPITVFKIPDDVSISKLSPVGLMKSGQTYTLQCNIINVAPVRNLSVNWYMDDKLCHTETFKDRDTSPVNKTSSFDLVARREDDISQIKCVAELNLWPTVPGPLVESSMEVRVLYPPTFMDPANETLEIRAGSKMILNCTATGNPSPGYSWHFPQDMQQANKNQKEDQPILTTSFQGPGTYNCTASNTQGTTTKVFTVIEAKGNRATIAGMVGGIGSLGLLLLVAGLFIVKPDGTFGFSNGSYLKGQPTSSQPV